MYSSISSTNLSFHAGSARSGSPTHRPVANPTIRLSASLITTGPRSCWARCLRLANDVAILSDLDGRRLRVADQPGPDSIEISSDESLVRSLDQLGVVSIEPGLGEEDSNGS